MIPKNKKSIMKMTQLKLLKEDMDKQKQKVVIFPFEYNGKSYSCLFEIIRSPFKLQIANMGKNPMLFKFDVLRGYIIETFLESEEYHRLAKMLGIEYDPEHVFRPSDFLRVLNRHIPGSCDDAKKAQNLEMGKRKDLGDEADKDIFIGWRINPTGSRVTDKNYEKSRRYFGIICADYWKSINTSTRWTNTLKK